MADVGRAVPASETRRALLTRPNFLLYWSAGLASNIGTWLQNVTASVVVLRLTHSPLAVGVLNFATFAPIFLFSPFGGSLSDRYDRRRIVFVSQSFSLVVAAILTVLTAAHRITAPILIAMAFVIGSSYSIAKPALVAILPGVVPRHELARAAAVNQSQFVIGQLAGSSLTALVLAIAGPAWAFGINAGSFLAPIVAMLFLRIHYVDTVKKRTGSGGGLEGLRFVWRSRTLFHLLVAVALSNASVEALRTLAPSVALKVLHLDDSAAGILITGYTAGASLGLLGFSWVSRHFRPRQIVTFAFLIQALGLIGVALSPMLYPAAVLAAPIGIGFALNVPMLSAALQQLSPDEYMGRVMSAYSMAHLGLRPLFALTAGALASLLNTRIALVGLIGFPLIAVFLLGRTGRALSAAAEGKVEESAVAAATSVTPTA